MATRQNLFTKDDAINIIMADIVLIIGFSLTVVGGLPGLINQQNIGATLLLVIAATSVGVTLSFVLHELMHKFVAEHFGAIAGFRASTMGLVITFASGLLGFLLGIPGATMIYVHNFSKKQNGLVSLAGPLTNFVIFGIFVLLYVAINPVVGSLVYFIISFTIFISILLAFFNMLPIFPLDGSKVLAWNKPIYVTTLLLIFVLMILSRGLFPIAALRTWQDIATLIAVDLAIAFFFSLFYRRVL